MRNLVCALLLAPLVGVSLAHDAPRTVEVAAKPDYEY
jgi:hypothetical protein